MGKFGKIAEKTGFGLPADGRRTTKDALDALLELSRSAEGRARQLACRNLCTCHVRADDDRVWTRLLRRRIRKTLAHYRRTGKVTDEAH